VHAERHARWREAAATHRRGWKMVTRSVVACMLSAALVDVLMANGPLGTAVHAGQSTVQGPAKVSHRTQTDSKLTDSLLTTNTREARVVWHRRGEGGVSWRRPESPRPPAAAPLPIPRRAVKSVVQLTSVSSRRQTPGNRSGGSLGTFAVRAYTHYHRPGQKPNRTATGTFPLSGRTVAVDPRVIPLGTKIHIEGVGERIAEDTGGRVKGKTLDLFLPSVQACRQFGVQHQEVHLMR
jgi:3D (Asp-Asp-Asp) domain-containing protein